jgi:hypothetical protein
VNEYEIEVVETTRYVVTVKARTAEEARADVQRRSTVWPSGLIRRTFRAARRVRG